MYSFCFTFYSLPSVSKVTTKGLSRLCGHRHRPNARDELVLIMIKEKKVTCRLNLLLLCLKLRKCSQGSTKKCVEVINRARAGHLLKIGVFKHLFASPSQGRVS